MFKLIACKNYAPQIRIEDSFQLVTKSVFNGKTFFHVIGEADIDRSFIEAKRDALKQSGLIQNAFIRTIRANKQFPRPFGTQAR